MFAKLTHAYRVWKSDRHESDKALAKNGRSGKWPTVRDTFLKTYPACSACGSREKMQVHHIKPFHLHPELELDSKNFVGLCMSKEECHLMLGHGGNFECFNPYILHDASQYLGASSLFRKTIKIQAKSLRFKNDGGAA